MKTIIKFLISALILLTPSQLFSQLEKEIKNDEVEGLYLNLSDFIKGRLIYPTDKQHKGDKIKLKQFFISPYITVIEQGVEQKFFKDSIFAIHLTNCENYRFINQDPCLIADTSYLYIYTHKTVKTEYKHSGPHLRTKESPITYYYFSLGNHKEIYMLTIANLRKYALINTILYTTVCNKFTLDEMLQELNPETGRFEINETILSIIKK